MNTHTPDFVAVDMAQIDSRTVESATAPPSFQAPRSRDDGIIGTLVTVASLVFVLYSQFIVFPSYVWFFFLGSLAVLMTYFRLWEEGHPRRTLACPPSRVPLHLNPTNLRLMFYERDFDERDYESLLALDADNPFHSRAARLEEVEMLPKTLASPSMERSQSHSSNQLTEPQIIDCSICLESVQDGEYVRTLPCNHDFHADCIDRWLLLQASCPICKQMLPGH